MSPAVKFYDQWQRKTLHFPLILLVSLSLVQSFVITISTGRSPPHPNRPLETEAVTKTQAGKLWTRVVYASHTDDGENEPSAEEEEEEKDGTFGCQEEQSTDSDNMEDDSLLLESLRRAANDKLGSPIPWTEYEGEAARRAESEFLSAMQDAQEAFAAARKQNGGSVNDAVQEILKKIHAEEDTLEELEQTIKKDDPEDDASPDDSFQ